MLCLNKTLRGAQPHRSGKLKFVKIALAQINPTVGDFAGNARLILDFTARAAAQAATSPSSASMSIPVRTPVTVLPKVAPTPCSSKYQPGG